MKLKHKLLSVVLSAVMLAPSAVISAGARTLGGSLDFTDANGAKTVVTYENGARKTFDGVLNPQKSENSAALAGVASYEIELGGKSMMTVTLHDINSSTGVGAKQSPMNGYYAVDIDNIEGNKSAFVTGLSASNVDEFQTALIESAAKGEELKLEDINFIDAEKQGIEDMDYNMCWAAASSNIFAYTGWARQAGFKDSDDLFEAFIDAFPDSGGNTQTAASWFFNGLTDPLFYDDPDSAPDNSKGGFLKDYAYETLVKENSFFDGVETMKALESDLRNGRGVVLNIRYVKNGRIIIMYGHAISCWGYVTDNNYAENKPEHYSMLIISDSDSDETGQLDRRTAPNKLCAHGIVPYTEEKDIGGYTKTWSFTGYGSYALDSYFSVAPYSESMPKETSAKATRDKKNTLDLNAADIFIGQNPYPDGLEPLPDDADLYASVYLKNSSFVDYTGSIKAKLTVTDRYGKEIKSLTKTFDSRVLNSQWDDTLNSINIGKLAEGKYTVTVTLNPDRELEEAYYYNNTVSKEISVIKSSFDRSDIKIRVDNPVPGYQKVKYDFHLDGITEEQLELIDGIEVYSVEELSYDSEGETLENEVDCDYDGEGIIPDGIYLYNNSELTLKVKLYLKKSKPVYIYSDQISVEYPSVSITFDYDLDYEPPEEINIDENSTEFIDTEPLRLLINNTDEEGGAVSGKFCLCALNENGHKIQITKPSSFTLKPGESKSVEIDRFDMPLPKGTYMLDVTVEGDFVWDLYDIQSVFINSGVRDYHFEQGDVDMNEELNIDDATLLQKYLALLDDFTDIQLELADVNDDGVVNIADVSCIQTILTW